MLQRVDRLEQKLVARELLLGHAALVGGNAARRDDVLVEDELVADLREQGARRLAHAHANHGLVKLAQLRNERREVRVAREDREGVDVVLRQAHLDRIDGQTDVGRVLARVGAVRDLDELDAQLVQGRHRVIEALPVTVGALGDDAPLVDETLEDTLDVGCRAQILMSVLPATARADTQVLIVDEHRDGALRGGHGKRLPRSLIYRLHVFGRLPSLVHGSCGATGPRTTRLFRAVVVGTAAALVAALVVVAAAARAVGLALIVAVAAAAGVLVGILVAVEPRPVESRRRSA